MIASKSLKMMLDKSLITGLSIGAGCGLALGMALKYMNHSASSSSNPADASVAPGELSEEIAEDGGFSETKLVLVVRQDLKMGKGKAAAQCCHAAVMAVEKLKRNDKELYDEWRQNGQPKVVVKAPDEASLLQLAEHGRGIGVTVSMVRDAGRTQIAPNSLTVIGVGPGPCEVVDAVTGHLKLL
ncbi:hypothetical protein CAPTEDRAFT_184538 [Capitella teleta]|uniref:peptidyl-tRNA hydrolase n=1 Tax=Capitella teleta TaxID=283909 RepID=R7TVN9_CAPTE|nr:hypothetical protein CAPTEDRAFT_184538 [Capitella teleta]|eukprot:ELT97953.1 hypothetical protein CAPTEDRAFT_184538 [Capitella teleta]